MDINKPMTVDDEIAYNNLKFPTPSYQLFE